MLDFEITCTSCLSSGRELSAGSVGCVSGSDFGPGSGSGFESIVPVVGGELAASVVEVVVDEVCAALDGGVSDVPAGRASARGSS